MKIHYALFDQAIDMGGGYYWTWSDEELPHELLTRFYNDFAVKHLAPEPNKLGDELWGGIVHIAEESLEKCGWLVLYREFDGGYDRQNRPNRFVIFTAWIRTCDLLENLEPVFSNNTFRYIAAHSKELPVPPPKVLSEVTNEPKMRNVFEKFTPFVNPYWDSHLKIENKPCRMDMTESDAFTKELDERFKAERRDKKRIKDELNEKLKCSEALLQKKELEWDIKNDNFHIELSKKDNEIRDRNAEINRLKGITSIRWQVLASGILIGVVALGMVGLLLFCTGDMKMNSDGNIRQFGKAAKNKVINFLFRPAPTESPDNPNPQPTNANPKPTT
jgi:hypothetical protein